MLKEWLEKYHKSLLFDDEHFVRQAINAIIEHDETIMTSFIDYKDEPDKVVVHVAWKTHDEPEKIETYHIEAVKVV